MHITVDTHGLLGALLTFIIAWVITSIPVWIASKAFSKDSSFGRALLATLMAYIVFSILVFIFTFIGLPLIGVIVGFIGILAVLKSVFDTGWLGALGIAILAVIVYIIIAFILALLGIAVIHLL
ncbi:hypothetical protein [Stygiolobus caldivivus]|uniref:Uncharacterized protein n=1 Tax=Stygiolobus caldivivus TaxID=2824673 RepID=A0A8D5U7U1_9CREN|nr:hypothetical protein [Stygiolobus caldivivus]BCU70939.1 hypothetical protein KN1_22360 [Stygiolobus caldivivus]